MKRFVFCNVFTSVLVTAAMHDIVTSGHIPYQHELRISPRQFTSPLRESNTLTVIDVAGHEVMCFVFAKDATKRRTTAVVPQSEIKRLVNTTPLFPHSSPHSIIAVYRSTNTRERWTLLIPHYCLVLHNSNLLSQGRNSKDTTIFTLAAELQHALSDEAFAVCCHDAGLLHYADPLLTLKGKDNTRRTLLRLLASEKLQLRHLLHNPLFALKGINDIEIFALLQEDSSSETQSTISFTLSEGPPTPANCAQHAKSPLISL